MNMSFPKTIYPKTGFNLSHSSNKHYGADRDVMDQPPKCQVAARNSLSAGLLSRLKYARNHGLLSTPFPTLSTPRVNPGQRLLKFRD
jgi:hypothetical protein